MNIPKYRLDFILHTFEQCEETLSSSLSEFAEDINISVCQQQEERGRDFRIGLLAQEPTAIFDLCAQFGRIRSVKVSQA